MVKPSGAKNCPDSPDMKPSGRNTTQVVTVDPRTDSPTVFTASTAALRRVFTPTVTYLSIARKQASRTTIELSTIMPTPSTSADIVIMLRE